MYKDTIEDVINSIPITSYKYLILTDSIVYSIYQPTIEKLKQKQTNIFVKVIPSGEASKSLDKVQDVLSFLFEKGFDRTDEIICLGGGVITDFGGFLASIYMRGIAFLSIPTTLLAMVDAAVGGKTGVNTRFGKNLVGSFYFPKTTFICAEFLNTLNH